MHIDPFFFQPPYKDFDEGSTSVTYGCVYFFISKHATHRWSEDQECNFKKRYICEYAPGKTKIVSLQNFIRKKE